MKNPLALRDGRVRIAAASLEAAARLLGTPAYAYSADALRGRFRAFSAAFSGRKPLVCYALKANPNLSICRVLARAGAGADIVSGGELARALEAGIRPEKIVYSGVGKTEPEMRAALRAGILAFNVESLEEARALDAAARRLRMRAPFAVRLNPDVDARTHAHVNTGHAQSKFGLCEKEALALYREAGSILAGLKPVGLQMHIGSQVAQTGPYKEALKVFLRVLGAVEALGVRLSHADVGGGMGISYGQGKEFDPRSLAPEVLSAFRSRPRLRLILEPGRWLIGPCGVLLTRVLYRKDAGGKRYVIVDAAMNDPLRPALYGAHHEVLPVRPRKGARRKMDVVGPVCESGDFLAKDRLLPPLEPGDLLAVLQAGAYGSSMGSQYNSRPRPAEAMAEGSRWRIVRRRESYEDLVRSERI
ncbi:MAG: diaminopimelate decarboxylase [Elusimicrobiota bacterium]